VYRLETIHPSDDAHTSSSAAANLNAPFDETIAVPNGQRVFMASGVVLDNAAIEARENAMVKLMLDGRKTAVIVLGGAHDLSDNVPVDCEYIHVTTNQYRRVAIGGE
jgi:hypothetical protein